MILLNVINFRVADIFKDCQEIFKNDKPAFLSLLEQHIDMDEMIPLSFRNHFIKQLKAYAKAKGLDESYDPYKAAYGSMPSHAAANSEIKQLYINGHFSKAYIPLNSRSSLENPDYSLNADGIPCCPHDETLPNYITVLLDNLRYY